MKRFCRLIGLVALAILLTIGIVLVAGLLR